MNTLMEFVTGNLFTLGWFLSVAWLMLTVYITENIQDPLKTQVQSVFVGIWVAIGVMVFIIF